MQRLPPGLVALIRLLPRLLFMLASVPISLKLFRALTGKPAPRWSSVLVYLFALPAVAVVKQVCIQIRDHREAARRGATLPPSIKYRWPGALDKLCIFVWNFSNGYLAEQHERECEEVGNTHSIYVLYENRIFTTEPEYIKEILATHFSSYDKGSAFRDQFDSLMGTSFLLSDGETWKFHRAIARPFFSKDRINDFDIFQRHADDAIHQMKVRLRQGYPVDFQDVASRFTLDSITELLLGKGTCSLSAGIVYPPSSPLSKDPVFLNHPSNRFIHAFVASQVATTHRVFYGSFWRLAEFWQDQVQKHMRTCYEFIDPIIADTLAKKHAQQRLGLDAKDGTNKAKDGDTFLEHLVNHIEDQTMLRDETVNSLTGGRDTTAATLTFSVYMLSQHPDVLARLREEIIANVGLFRRPTYDDIQGMKYLRAFIHEVLRLYPPVPFNTRSSIEGQTWPAVNGGKPLYIPPATAIFCCVFLLHRRKDLWGPDADLFDPDRFLDERLHKYLSPNPFIFLPFSAGPRTCLGQQFSYNEISYFLIRLLQSMDAVSLDMETQRLPPSDWAQAKGRKGLEKVILRSHLTMYVEGGLWVRMKEDETANDV